MKSLPLADVQTSCDGGLSATITNSAFFATPENASTPETVWPAVIAATCEPCEVTVVSLWAARMSSGVFNSRP